jgi:hypothetical protein
VPLGAIHLIQKEADRDADAAFFCGIHDAIAAIHPVRLKDFPEDAICRNCLNGYHDQSAAQEPWRGGDAENAG